MVTALVGGAVLLRERLFEEWYLRKLRSADDEEALRAAEVLGRLGSIRAVPEMLGLVARPGVKASSKPASTGRFAAYRPIDLDDLQPPLLPFAVFSRDREHQTPLQRLLREAAGIDDVASLGAVNLRGNVSVLVAASGDDAAIERLLETIRKVSSILDGLGDRALPAIETVATDPGLHPATRAFADYYLARRRRDTPVLSLPEEGTEVLLRQRSSTVVPGSSAGVYLSISDVTAGQVHVWVTLASGETLIEDRSLREGDELPLALGGKGYVLRLKDLRNKLIGHDWATFTIAEQRGE